MCKFQLKPYAILIPKYFKSSKVKSKCFSGTNKTKMKKYFLSRFFVHKYILKR